MRAAPLLLLAPLGCALACSPSRTPERATVCAAPLPRPRGLIVAGSGSNLALVRLIARRYQQQHPEARVIVPESIGTGGAIGALRDRAIDVGLASRPLRADERASGLLETALARTRLVLAAHPRVTTRTLRGEAVVEIFGGSTTSWDDGTPIVPLVREPGDSGWPVLRAWLPEVERSMTAAARERRWKVCYTDREMQETLLSIPGALGFVDEGTLRLEAPGLRTIQIAGAPPSALKPLSFVTAGPPAGEAARFIAFARSPSTATMLASGSYLPP